jgi:hypothetical protein
VDIRPEHKTAAVTICATNYLGKALALRQSYLEYHPESDFYVLIVDNKHDKVQNLAPDIRILWVEDLGINDFFHYAMKFDVIELSTNVKATILSVLLCKYDIALYLDPDIYFYESLQYVFADLVSHSVVVTPHALTPVMDGKSPSDLDFLRFGAFNLGFVGVSKCEEGFKFLDWWSKRCLEFGFYEPQRGLAVDQKWMDLCSSFFPGMKVLRDPGLNVAFWNLHERSISKCGVSWLVNGKYPLRFFHFSSFNTTSPHAIAEKQSRFAADSRPDLHELLDSYAARLRANESDSYSGCPYSFDYFEDGTYVTPSLRRFYAALESHFPVSENPFSRGSSLQRFALARGLVGKKYQISKRETFKEIGSHSTAAGVIAIGLRFVLRLIGPNRYFSLMRYLAYVSSIRTQANLFPLNSARGASEGRN